MTERSIDELLSRLPESSSPDPSFEAALRARLTAELHAEPDIAGSDSPGTDQRSTTEVIEMQTIPRPATSPPEPKRSWMIAAAVVAIVAGGVAVLALVQRDSSPSNTTTPETPLIEPTTPDEISSDAITPDTAPAPATTAPSTTPDATFVGATVETFAVATSRNPYFVGAGEQVWVSTLAGELVRLDPGTGEVLQRVSVPESSPIAVDANAVWVADAISGDVLRLDPVDGAIVTRIETGVEIIENAVRFPMLEGTTRAFAQIGGIVSTGDAVWVGDRAGSVMRIDPATNEIVETFDVPVRPDLLRADGDLLLAADLLGAGVAVVDVSDGTVVYEATDLDDLAGAALYGGAVYLQDRATGTVTRTDLATGHVLNSVALGASVERSSQPTMPTGLVVSGAGVLVDVDTAPDSLHVLDPISLVEVGTLAVTADQGDMTIAADGSVWLVRSQANAVAHITPVPR